MSEVAKCELCGEPMPPGEQMFKFHGYSGPCPKPFLPKPENAAKETARVVLDRICAYDEVCKRYGSDGNREPYFDIEEVRVICTALLGS